jgi:ketosteroid isomerase-like protein
MNVSIDNQIRELTKKWNQASFEMDILEIASLYSDQCIFHFPNGQATDKEWVIKLLSSGNVTFESIQNEDIRIRAYGDAVLWTSRTSVIETYNKQRSQGQYLWLRLWAPHDDSWQIVAFQSTPIPA